MIPIQSTNAGGPELTSERAQVQAQSGVVCEGTGANGDHCCYIEGKVCEFLDTDTVRCTVWDQMPFPAWEEAPVGKFFARLYPGYTCQDWPQNIPAAMAGTGRCCWENS